jgi:hypothetical protein
VKEGESERQQLSNTLLALLSRKLIFFLAGGLSIPHPFPSSCNANVSCCMARRLAETLISIIYLRITKKIKRFFGNQNMNTFIEKRRKTKITQAAAFCCFIV